MALNERSVTVRVPDEMYRRFSAYVAWNGTTLAAVVREAMERYIAENEHLAKNFPKEGGDEGE